MGDARFSKGDVGVERRGDPMTECGTDALFFISFYSQSCKVSGSFCFLPTGTCMMDDRKGKGLFFACLSSVGHVSKELSKQMMGLGG